MRIISLSCVLAVSGFLLTQTVTGCGSSSSNSNGGGATGADCKSVCAKSDALKCPMTTQGDCAMQCDSSPPACKSQLDALSACGATAMVMCDAMGEAKVVGCDQQTGAYISCVFMNFDGGI